ncbi:hypothetical protein ACPOL_4148 [Acidisarcina polymorpha]|uniref:Uncharacterized protein n=1 Tax=Acidisarcina polymorpha TaxID=2211140 RepID=A0A2Z5G441_9BACT|nr:hypothetical protein [Acidisarcina polymorpha]AXC13425.1 hypothetical protein ACPOL_4148 [Acidisarcina polymorpha]
MLIPTRLMLFIGVYSALFCANAQVVPTLSPSLDEAPTSTPVTTLSIDLLSPQRTYTVDATGASVFANAFDPTVNASDWSLAVAETDTAIRDSTQAGQYNPYGSRLGFRLAESIGSSQSTNMTSTAGAAGRAGSENNDGIVEANTAADINQGLETESSHYHSTWGGTSAAGPERGGSAWGLKSAPVNRMGSASDPASLPDSGIGSGYSQLSLDSSSLQSQRAGSDLNRSSATEFSRDSNSRASMASRDKFRYREQSSRVASSYGDLSGLPSSPTTLATSRVGSILSTSHISSQRSTPPRPGDAHSAANLLEFSPHSYTDYSFGMSPFSPPGAGDGELSFLNPDILNVSGFSTSFRKTGVDIVPQRTYGSNDWSKSLPTSGNHYGLTSEIAPGRNSTGSDRKRPHKNPFLTGDELGPSAARLSGRNP